MSDFQCENCTKLEEDVDRLRESEKFFSEKCGDAELKVLELKQDVDRLKKNNNKIVALEWKIKAMVKWLEDNQRDVFSKGLWDVLEDYDV